MSQRVASSTLKKAGLGELATSDDAIKVYVGNLGRNGDESEIRRKFEKCGEIKSVWVARSPPGFAFVEFYEREDAEYAVDRLDGK